MFCCCVFYKLNVSDATMLTVDIAACFRFIVYDWNKYSVR